MSEQANNENNYPFYWLDELTEVILNPEKTPVDNLKLETLLAIRERLPKEISRVSTALKSQAFCLYRSEQLKVFVGHYDRAIRVLQEQVRVNLALYPEKDAIHDTGQLLLDNLNELFLTVRRRYSVYLAENPPEQPEDREFFKVLCRLSVDQIAIILKAADDTKLLVSRSFSLILRRIVPFLSTERLKDFSWKSARSSTYKMEQSDKEIALKTLEALIYKIREY